MPCGPTPYRTFDLGRMYRAGSFPSLRYEMNIKDPDKYIMRVLAEKQRIINHLRKGK